ncbi:nuclear envelope-associated protein 2-like isoform X1 [Macadamia integrifolia]|uniref:nuclear envelope-associated protein 2-like isoform X1 n=1 Tax=Macadamia integrifolia TaxID=60698 RepID=UPI001C52F933|nr:nuclear envelope-associated protein 2-like isoform X1 [Macadamia integrifolia]
MSISEKPSSSSSAREFDPLLKDLSEKKQSFRRNVVSLAAELKDVRSRLASQEESFARETLTRQVAETRARSMEEEIVRLEKSLEERDGQLQASASTAEQISTYPSKTTSCRLEYLKELDALRLQLSDTQATADASAASAQSAQLQCLALAKELDEKNSSLKEHEDRVNRLGEQLDHLQKDLQAREGSQKQLKDEVLRIEQEIMQAIAKAGSSKDCELRKILDEVSPKNFERINKLLTVKDEEIAKLRDEIKIMSAHWKLKTKELESQLEKHRKADQELKKRVLKLEFCLQEARSQTRKLQRMGERRDKALKELRDQLVMKQQGPGFGTEKQNFWDSSGFKIVVSMSMLILVVFAKR